MERKTFPFVKITKQSIEMFFSVSILIDAKQTVKKKKLFKQSTSEFKKKKKKKKKPK